MEAGIKPSLKLMHTLRNDNKTQAHRERIELAFPPRVPFLRGRFMRARFLRARFLSFTEITCLI